MEYRLRGKDSWTGEYYYGFKNLRWLNNQIELKNLEYFESRKNLRNDVPGACIIKDPIVE